MTETEAIEAPPERVSLPPRAHWARDVSRAGPAGVVAAVVAFNLVFLRQESSVVSTLNDSSFHEQMVRFATLQFQSGHFPLDSWFPYLGLGSPLFMHYQSLGATLTGLLGVVIGPDRAFSLMLYLLLSLWPICIYFSARLLGLSRWQAAAAAAISSFVASNPTLSIGYEQQSYLWVGFGVWSQLFGMWALPLSWGFTTRAIRTGRGYLAALCFITLTVASHYLTGYLTVLPLVFIPLIRPSEFWTRLRRSALIALGAGLASAWVTFPLERFGRWTAVNEFLQGTPAADSYGARQVLAWLAQGSLFDAGHILPVISIAGAIGLVAAVWKWRDDEVPRALAVLFGASLVLFFGRPTLGALIDLLPGHRDLFLRRFLMGVQLSWIYLAGIGICALTTTLRSLLLHTYEALVAQSRGARVALRVAVVAVALTALAPCWAGALTTDDRDAADVRVQMSYDPTQGQDVDELVAKAQSIGPGRFFAGMPNDVWGPNFTVGLVPVFKYLANLDVDIVGYTLRTSSLMTDPEEYFDEYEPADYALFGVRYLILPSSRTPSVHADFVARIGGYSLWQIPGNGYLRVVDTRGVIVADRSNIGLQTADFVRSALALNGPYPVIAYAGEPPAAATSSASTSPSGPAGQVVSSSANLQEGTVDGSMEVRHKSVVVLSASYDPGWTATVDGVTTPTEMIAPALVGVVVSPGRHQVDFRYRPPSYYPELFGIAAVTIIGFAVVPAIARRRRPRTTPAEPQ
jgi:hypothetical protein